jgi:hypothetical protein
MSETTGKDFIEMVSNEGEDIFINLTNVLTVDEISDTHCRLRYGTDFTLSINGDGASLVVREIRARSNRITGKISR